ncbi:hypothetical protein [Novosphingobium sp. PASSN1]|uniref:hypothetical protein n=1 Tax=Novosphingobium sp. PASSN1 TaxID=2015561 RepID=UPI000BCAE9CF|nr:hypothetical protein [Novosphingobium sp. PASSN1]OYU35340.1 MAG: hypothetical protein CFE35_10175 [Novosphingobium sp. PASSN1]
MGQVFQGADITVLPQGDAPQTLPAPPKNHPVRSMTFGVLRFVSVLIGAGLLLRTASAEYVVSAPQGPSQSPDKLAPARITMPQPAFGRAASQPVVAAVAKVRVVSIPAAAVHAAPAAPGRQRGPLPAADAAPALAPVAAARIAGHATSAPAITPRVPQPDAGLLAPVRIVSGAPVVRAPAGPAASVVARPAEPQPVQIVLAPPPMRPGPRTTALTSDVSAEMRRPASAWDYAEALPPELTGRGAASQGHAAAQPQIAPKAPAMRPEPFAAAASASPNARTSAPITADRAAAPRPLALLDVAPAPRPKDKPRRAPMAERPARSQSAQSPARAAATAAAPPLLAEDRRNRLVAAPFAMPAADQRRSRKERAVQDDAAAALQEVSLQEPGFGLPSDPVATADGTGTTGTSSLRDRMPLPAF